MLGYPIHLGKFLRQRLLFNTNQGLDLASWEIICILLIYCSNDGISSHRMFDDGERDFASLYQSEWIFFLACLTFILWNCLLRVFVIKTKILSFFDLTFSLCFHFILFFFCFSSFVLILSINFINNFFYKQNKKKKL